MLAEVTLKRCLSDDTDSECEQEDHCGSPLSSKSAESADSGCYVARKKQRRGLIEKRRRDRINNSLNDLKNLIPTAHERQASAKLEKSEVLSLAVEHIKSLTAKVESASPHTLMMDYKSLGYRQCICDVGSYLMHGENLGPNDPLHHRIVSHLYQQPIINEPTPAMPAQLYNYNMATGSPTVYATSPSACYEPVTLCKPEPPISPSYCDALSGVPENYNTYTKYNTGYDHCQQVSSLSYQWNSVNSLAPVAPASSIPASPAMQHTFVPQSDWS